MTHTSNNLQILHFDTIGQWGVQTPSSVFYKSGFHPFNLTLSLPNQISKVKKIYLKSVNQINNIISYMLKINLCKC